MVPPSVNFTIATIMQSLQQTNGRTWVRELTLRCGTVRHGYAGRTGDGADSTVACPVPRSCPGALVCSCALCSLGRTRVLPAERVILAQNFLKIVDVCSVESKEC